MYTDSVVSPEDCKNGVTGAIVRQLRKELLVSQRQFSALLKVSPAATGQWERRERLGLRSEKKFRTFVQSTYEERLKLAQGKLPESKPLLSQLSEVKANKKGNNLIKPSVAIKSELSVAIKSELSVTIKKVISEIAKMEFELAKLRNQLKKVLE